jgi:hypothetical protein
MNDLIQRIEKECTEEILGVKILNKEKFAESIVRECADLFRLAHTDEQYSRRIDKTILKHFGYID